MRSTLLLALIFAACGGSDAPTPDASTIPAMITVSGIASGRTVTGSMPLAGVSVAAYKVADDTTPVVTATTNATGMYTLVIPTNGVPLDGYVKATITGYVTTYLYPPAPLTADFGMGSINMLNTTTFGLLSTLAQANQQPGQGVIALEIIDPTNAVVKGATATSSPAANPTVYNGKKSDGTSTGLPDKTSTATQDDGVAYLFNLAPGVVTVGAMGTATYKAHPVKAFADQFTTTLVGQ